MAGTIRDHYEAFPDPSPLLIPVGPNQIDRTDDTLHFGWSWSRHRFTYRSSENLNILDAGSGTGWSTLGLAKLNPHSKVVGVDFSQAALAIAAERLATAGLEGVTFLEHDLNQPLPSDLGPYDYVIARGILGTTADPSAILTNLRAVLAPNGLLLATFPSATGRLPARQLCRAIDALVGPDASTDERAEAGLELLQTLRPDHPIRRFDASRHHGSLPTKSQFIVTYLNDVRMDWTLEDCLAVIESAGLRALEVADRGGWHPDRVFGSAIPITLRDRVNKLGEAANQQLRDALDISLHPDIYTIFVVHRDYQPHIPAWPDDVDGDVFDSLIPQPIGLTLHANLMVDPAAERGNVSYRAVNGAIGEVPLRSHMALKHVDGKLSIGEIESAMIGGPFETQPPEARRQRWIDLAHRGFTLLKAPDPRQNIDCEHLGTIKDRLDCACPRRWIRTCDLHGFCSVSTVGPDDEKYHALQQGLARLGIAKLTACDGCGDYRAES